MNSGFSSAKSRPARLLASTGLSALAITLATPVLAQDNAQSDEDEQVTVANAPVTQENTPIVVTGSRIRRNETTSSSPLTIIDPSIQRKQGASNTAEIIQQSPIANGSTQITSAISACWFQISSAGSA